MHTRNSKDSNNSLWEIIFDCPRMEPLRDRDFGSLTSEERGFILIRIERAKQAVQAHLGGSPQKDKGRRTQQNKPPPALGFIRESLCARVVLPQEGSRWKSATGDIVKIIVSNWQRVITRRLFFFVSNDAGIKSGSFWSG